MLYSLSKSKYCNGIQCKKMLWLYQNKPEVENAIDNNAVLDNGHEVGDLAKKLFGDYKDIPFSNNLQDMIDATKEALNNKNIVITEASFNYDHNFCSVDILKKLDNTYEIYEVKSSTEIKEIYLDDIAYQFYILTNLGYKVTKASIVHINSQYVRKGDLDLHKLFNIDDVTQIVLDKQDEIKQNINEIRLYMEQKEEPKDDLDIKCFKPYACPFFQYCTKDLPLNNIFNIRRMHNSVKIKYYQKGLYAYEDLLNEKLDNKFKQQMSFTLYHKEPYINIDNIKSFMKNLYYPLYFLDFETYQQAIPEYDDIKPYMQIPFQYSLHYILKEDDALKHKEFLAQPDIDPRRSLAEKLVQDIPKNSCVIAYNMMFEKMVIKSLAHLYPDLKDHLMNIYNHMQDLMIPFKNRDYYTEQMVGSYSIKYVLPALFPDDPSLDYHNLDMVHNGSEASNSYANMGKLSLEEQNQLRSNLLKYCKLDTYAMVKIWQKLDEIIK